MMFALSFGDSSNTAAESHESSDKMHAVTFCSVLADALLWLICPRRVSIVSS